MSKKGMLFTYSQITQETDLYRIMSFSSLSREYNIKDEENHFAGFIFETTHLNLFGVIFSWQTASNEVHLSLTKKFKKHTIPLTWPGILIIYIMLIYE